MRSGQADQLDLAALPPAQEPADAVAEALYG
jgi:hypothetical protein